MDTHTKSWHAVYETIRFDLNSRSGKSLQVVDELYKLEV